MLLATVTSAYIVMSLLTSLILSNSIMLLQIAIVLSLFFIGITISATIISVAISSGYQKEKREKELLSMSNTMMEKNYSEVRLFYSTIRKQVHDFKNHLRTLAGMLPEESTAKEYIDDLLEVSYKQVQSCSSGNEVIDSIINCKMYESTAQNIEFFFKVQLPGKLYMSSVDICAILANQIDNAIEACVKVEEGKPRNIKVEIWYKEAFLFFKVTNTSKEKPFTSSGKLETTKADKEHHGFGIKSITETAEKYGGYLKNDFTDNRFTSLVMIPNND